jgi:hypothetical protein
MIKEGRLTPVQTLYLYPEEECTIYVVFTPSATKRPIVKGKLRKLDSKIVIEMLSILDNKITYSIPNQKLKGPKMEGDDNHLEQANREILVSLNCIIIH